VDVGVGVGVGVHVGVDVGVLVGVGVHVGVGVGVLVSVGDCVGVKVGVTFSTITWGVTPLSSFRIPLISSPKIAKLPPKAIPQQRKSIAIAAVGQIFLNVVDITLPPIASGRCRIIA
jgi:hypothetical protein